MAMSAVTELNTTGMPTMTVRLYEPGLALLANEGRQHETSA
jgi:hypothetical protein